jgi:hypothetical protein
VRDLIKKSPKAYMDQIWICFNTAAERPNIPHVVDMFGADRFMVNSDFPHGLGGAGEAMADMVYAIDELSPPQKEELLGLSACRLFGIDPVTRKHGHIAATSVVSSGFAGTVQRRGQSNG